MKKISIIFNLIFIGIIAVMTSSMFSGRTPERINFTTCVDCTNDSFYGLTLKEFVKGVARYRKTHWDRINTDAYMQTAQIGGLKDARACWYSIDTLKKFICLIEKYSSGLGLKSDKLGIRFYYATYPKNVSWNPLYYSRHTLFMTPTYRDDSTKNRDNIDFDPRYNVQAKRGLQPLSQIGDQSSSIQLLVLDGASANRITSSMAKNQGQLCPPTCPRTTGLPATSNTMEYVDRMYPSGLTWSE